MSDECEHGSLRRSCLVCELIDDHAAALAAKDAELAAERDEVELKAACIRGMEDKAVKLAEERNEWKARAERAEKAEAELAALRAELQKVRSAAIRGMDAATQHGRGLVQQAAKLRAESNPDALESERAANALLTEQLEKAEAEAARLQAAIEQAPHDKHCVYFEISPANDCDCWKRAALGER